MNFRSAEGNYQLLFNTAENLMIFLSNENEIFSKKLFFHLNSIIKIQYHYFFGGNVDSSLTECNLKIYLDKILIETIPVTPSTLEIRIKNEKKSFDKISMNFNYARVNFKIIIFFDLGIIFYAHFYFKTD